MFQILWNNVIVITWLYVIAITITSQAWLVLLELSSLLIQRQIIYLKEWVALGAGAGLKFEAPKTGIPCYLISSQKQSVSSFALCILMFYKWKIDQLAAG